MPRMKNTSRVSKSWSPALRDDLAQRATIIAIEVAQRCSSLKLIRQILDDHTKAQDQSPLHWLPSSVAGGDAGIALLSSYMDQCFPNKGWDKTAHQYLAQAITSYIPRFPDVGLFSGVTGLAFTALYASQGGTQYVGLHQNLHTYLEQQVPHLMRVLSKRTTLSVPAFDLVSGAAGIAVYFTTLPKDTLSSALIDACDATLSYLISLARADSANGLRCFISPENIRLDERRKAYPYGYTDTGLAHGISGVIGALAVAIRAGWDRPGIRDALASLAQWLATQSVQDEYGINWPPFIQPRVNDKHSAIVHSRAAWCYGTPGIARAFFLAGEALHDDALRQTAAAAFDALISRPRDRWGIASPNICHGLSGILLASLRMYHDTKHASIQPFIEQLTQEIVSLYHPGTLLGFQDRYGRYDWYDNPRLLEGAPGVALSLLAASQGVNPEWDRFFLLS